MKTSPTSNTIGMGRGGVGVCFSRFVGLSGPSRGIIISPPRLRRPRVGNTNEQVRVSLISSLGTGAACAVSFSSTVDSGGRNGPVKGCACDFSAKTTVSAVRMSKRILRSRGLRPIGNVLIKLCTSRTSSTFHAGPVLQIDHASDHNHFIVGNITPNSCHVCTLRSRSNSCGFDRGDRGVTFSRSVVIPSYGPSIERSAA